MAADQTPCACGSGLKLSRCCGLDPATSPSADAVGPLRPAIDEAAEQQRLGNLTAADGLCREVLELMPLQPEALTTLWRVCRADGRVAAAEALLRRIVRFYPNTLWATHELTLLLLNKGILAEAEIHARNAIRIAPENAQSHSLMGMVMTEANRPAIGEYHYRRVIELSRERDPILLANLAWNLKNQGRMAESRRLYVESASQAPDIVPTLLGWARMEEADRNFARAGELLDRAEMLLPTDPGILLARAVLHGRTEDYAEALSVLDRIASAATGGLGASELLEKGRLLDRMGHWNDAFAAFEEAKRLCREVSGLAYQAAEAQALADRLRGFFTETRMTLLPRARPRADLAQPIFVLGFPRSGTTLVEQTLSAHPRIIAGDELPIVNDLTATMPRMLSSPLGYPDALAELWMGDCREALDELRDYYLNRVQRLGILSPEAAWFTDKMPLNETHLGLIALIFPQAPLIHVLRHPLDVVLSTFANHLTHGFYCAYGLESAARHYLLTLDLVEHYRGQLALRYLPVRYEDLVSDQRATVSRMLDFIGEPFDPRCLDFHENRRYARTASYAQVTEPLYDSSRYRWRHYRRQLAPAIEILREAIERLGYAID